MWSVIEGGGWFDVRLRPLMRTLPPAMRMGRRPDRWLHELSEDACHRREVRRLASERHSTAARRQQDPSASRQPCAGSPHEPTPGLWNFRFFNLQNGLPEQTINGHEEDWVAGCIDWLTVNKDAFKRSDTNVYPRALGDDSHLRASFEWFRAFNRDNVRVTKVANDPDQRTPK
jgi:hypothetical protein